MVGISKGGSKRIRRPSGRTTVKFTTYPHPVKNFLGICFFHRRRDVLFQRRAGKKEAPDMAGLCCHLPNFAFAPFT
jgi:hypothetical protein